MSAIFPAAERPPQAPIAHFAPADRTVPAMLRAQAERHGDRWLLVAGDSRWRFADACQAAAAWGATLRAAGIGAGDRVALLCGNRIEFMQVFLGCAWVGAVVVPINTASRGEGLRHVLANSGARLLVAEADGLQAVRELLARDSRGVVVEEVWVLAGHASGAAPGSGSGAAPGNGAADVPDGALVHAALPWRCRPFPEPADAAADGEAGAAAAPAPLRPGDTLAILYTSGTTGPSKGVCCPHAQYYWWAVHSADLLGLVHGETLVTTLPLFHTNALNAFFQALLTGSTLVVDKRFSASGFWALMHQHQATVTYVLGAMVPILLAQAPSPLDRGHRVRIALAPGVPPQFQAAFTARFGLALLEGYGSTETNFVIGMPVQAQRPGTMGRVRDGFEAQVVDAEDNPVPDGEAGELVIRSREPFSMATGYHGMPDKTVEAWRNLWFHTGDRVIRDGDGFFRFVDRLKDAIRRRGENISSYEVEQVLLSHPDVELAAVFPVRSELAEDEVMAALVLRPGARWDPVALTRFCEPRLAYFAVPRYLEAVAQLPATENGKVQKFRLRERGIGPATWDREAAGLMLRRR